MDPNYDSGHGQFRVYLDASDYPRYAHYVQQYSLDLIFQELYGSQFMKGWLKKLQLPLSLS